MIESNDISAGATGTSQNYENYQAQSSKEPSSTVVAFSLTKKDSTQLLQIKLRRTIHVVMNVVRKACHLL